MSLTRLTIDFETFWSPTHSLSKMNPITYVMHPETELISLAYQFDNDEPHVIFGEPAIQQWANAVDWTDKFVIGHNLSGFDAMILAWRLGVRPRMWGCTLAMARPHHAITVGGSLAKLVEHYGIGKKDNTALLETRGKHLGDFTVAERDAMAEYNKADVRQCAELFRRLAKVTPKDELRLIDLTVRMLVEPRLRVDTALLEATLAAERLRKTDVLKQLAVTLGCWWPGMSDDEAAQGVAKVLGSSQKFSALLQSRGVVTPTKISKTTGEPTLALAKTDAEFVALKDHPDDVVAAAARCRLEVKSTQLETRIESFLEVAGAVEGAMPIALNYYGASTTGRWSGAMGLNQQNLPRVGKSPKPGDALRNCLLAPVGHKIVVVDLSGIELRINHFLWNVSYSTALFEADPAGADLYRHFAAHDLYHVPEAEVTKEQRQIGKIAHLGLGYGAGGKTFQQVARLMGGVDMSEREATDVVQAWREAHAEIVAGWKTCHQSLGLIASLRDDQATGQTYDAIDPWGLCVPVYGGIRTPKGFIWYPSLRQDYNKDNGKLDWVYGEGRHKTRIYAGKVTENIVQHLARLVLAEHMLAIRRRYPIVHSVHDEVVVVVPYSEADAALAFMLQVMRTPPSWWPELAVWAEGGYGQSYGEAK